MPEITRHYTMHLITLAPLHIGSGRELLLDYDYVVYKGRTWRVDEEALFDALMRRGDFAPDDPASKLLHPHDYRSDSPLFRYVIKGHPRSRRPGARLREQIKDSSDHPYLPGSSLKGALRTALVDWALEQNPQALDTRRLKDNRKWAAQPLERTLLGRSPNHDLLRALQVGDSLPLDPNRTLTIENAQVLTAGQSGSPIEVEALRPEVRLRVPIKLDLSLFTPQAEQQLHFGHKRKWLEDLMTICRNRARMVIAAEQEWFNHHYPRSRAAVFYDRLHDLVTSLPVNRALIQIGWGGGWQNKTIGLRMSDRQREDVIRRYRLARGRRRRGDPFPKSRRVVLDEQEQPIVPFGWVLVEMKEAQ